MHRAGPEDVWPAPVASFLARRAAPQPEGPAESVRILAPARDSIFRWLPDLDLPAQRLAFTGASDRPGELLYWFVNDRPVGRSRPGEPLFWPLERGRHQIVCSTDRGLGDHIQIAVE